MICVGARAQVVLRARLELPAHLRRGADRRRSRADGQILADTPLARGEWVRGTQPLNYDASDNVGVRTPDASRGHPSGSDVRPCAFASPERTYADRLPCPNGRARSTSTRPSSPEGTQPLACGPGPRGQRRQLPRGDRRIDNTPPARVDVDSKAAKRGATATTSLSSGPTRPRSTARRSSAAGYKLCRVGAGSCGRAADGRRPLAFRRRSARAGRVDGVAVAPRRRRQRDRGGGVGTGDAPLRPRAAAARLRAADRPRPHARGRRGHRQGLRAGERGDRDQRDRLGHLAGAVDADGRAADCSPGSTTPCYRPAATCCGHGRQTRRPTRRRPTDDSTAGR